MGLEDLEVIDCEVDEVTNAAGFSTQILVDFPGMTEDKIEFCRLKSLGYKDHEIMMRLGVSRPTLRKMKSDPACLAIISEITSDALESARNKILEASEEAFNTLKSLLNSDNDGVRLGAAKEILDRAGLKPVERKLIQTEISVSDLTEEEIKRRLLRLGEGS